MKTETWELDGLRLWLARLGDLEAGEWPRLYAQMDGKRQERCRRYRRQTDQKRCILADALAREALCRGTALPPENVTFGKEPGGKPYATGLDKHFSLSHSGSLVLCAVADFPVGADIQRARPVPESLTHRLERAGYRGSSEEDFFAWWVRQEAAGKLEGTGLSLRPLTGERDVHAGVLEEADGRYFYCVCAPKGSFLWGKNVIQ